MSVRGTHLGGKWVENFLGRLSVIQSITLEMHQCKLLANIHVIRIYGQDRFKEGLIIEDFSNLVLSDFLHAIICIMQYQTTPNMKDKTFNIPQFYEVGQMKD